jgi:hypothetical protein
MPFSLLLNRSSCHQIIILLFTGSVMKNIIGLLIIAIIAFSSCKAKYSFNSYEGKKKLKHYNSIQYGNTQYPNAKKRNR